MNSILFPNSDHSPTTRAMERNSNKIQKITTEIKILIPAANKRCRMQQEYIIT